MTTTRDAMIERYHSLSRRGTWHSPGGRRSTLASLDRVLSPVLPASREARILDVGCGEGAVLGLLREKGYRRLAGFDLSEENVALCRAAGLGFVECHDALDINGFAPGERFDAVLLIDLIEHLPKAVALPVLTAATLRLKEGGRLIVQTPNMGSIFAAFHRHNDLTHEWGVTERSLTDLLHASGFAVDRIRVLPAWGATTVRGRLREWYLRALHRAVCAAEGRERPRIPTGNLLAVAVKR